MIGGASAAVFLDSHSVDVTSDAGRRAPSSVMTRRSRVTPTSVVRDRMRAGHGCALHRLSHTPRCTCFRNTTCVSPRRHHTCVTMTSAHSSSSSVSERSLSITSLSLPVVSWLHWPSMFDSCAARSELLL